MEAVLVRLDQGKDKSELAKSVTVLDACYWLASAVKSVKQTTVKKCFAKSGLGEDILGTDPDKNIPLAELVRRTQERLGITDSITAEEYVNFDDNIEIWDDAESMINFEENLIKDYTANTVNKEDNTYFNESDEEDGKASTQSKHNQCTIRVMEKQWISSSSWNSSVLRKTWHSWQM